MKVVIVGGGFAGLKIARRLNNKPGFEVLLIDKYNYHQFQPLFYQVATASLDASNISFPLRKMFQKSKNLTIRMAEVEVISPTTKTIGTNIGSFGYDVLILATGADTNFFGNTHVQQYAFPMKSTTEALTLRHRLISNFEEALATTNAADIERLMTVVIVGGGATGVELSGAISEMKKYVLQKDYPDLDFSKMRIILLEGGPKTLGAMSEKSSADSLKYLLKLGVDVRTSTVVKDYDGKTVLLQDGSEIQSSIVIWAAGIKGNVPAGIDPTLVTRGNRIVVDRYNKIKGFEDIYALGDVAYMETPKYPKGHPQVATVAIQQAGIVAENLLRIERKSTKFFEFEYHDKGSMATVGRNLAVVDIPKPKFHFGGFFAWLVWMGLHLFLLVGVKNRIQVLSIGFTITSHSISHCVWYSAIFIGQKKKRQKVLRKMLPQLKKMGQSKTQWPTRKRNWNRPPSLDRTDKAYRQKSTEPISWIKGLASACWLQRFPYFCGVKKTKRAIYEQQNIYHDQARCLFQRLYRSHS